MQTAEREVAAAIAPAADTAAVALPFWVEVRTATSGSRRWWSVCLRTPRARQVL